MNPEMVMVGILLLGGMAAGGVNLYLRRRRDRILDILEADTQNLQGAQTADKDI